MCQTALFSTQIDHDRLCPLTGATLEPLKDWVPSRVTSCRHASVGHGLSCSGIGSICQGFNGLSCTSLEYLLSCRVITIVGVLRFSFSITKRFKKAPGDSGMHPLSTKNRFAPRLSKIGAFPHPVFFLSAFSLNGCPILRRAPFLFVLSGRCHVNFPAQEFQSKPKRLSKQGISKQRPKEVRRLAHLPFFQLVLEGFLVKRS